MSYKTCTEVINSFEFDETLAHRNEHLIRSMYCAFIKYEECIPSVSDIAAFIRKYNIDQLAKHLGEPSNSDAVWREYERLEDKNMFVMMEDYVRTVIAKIGWTIYDSPGHIIASGLLPEFERVPDVVVYGDAQNLVFPQFAKCGVCAQGGILNVQQAGVQFLSLGDGA